MPIVDLPIDGGFYLDDSLPVSAQELTNWWVDPVQTDTLTPAVLRGTPGIGALTTTGPIKQINRGSHVKNGVGYVINGDALYRVSVDEDGVFSTGSPLGTIDGEGFVSTADNGVQLIIIVPGVAGYIYNENDGTPFQQITDSDFVAVNAQHVRFVDSYFAVTGPTKTWAVSANNDGLSWSGTDFGSAEADPDNIVAPVVLQNQIYITGSETTETYRNVGGAGFPFQRINGAIYQKGCFAPFSLINTDQSFIMIGGSTNERAAVWEFTGNGFEKRSTTAVDNVLQRATAAELAAAFAVSWAERGAFFVAFTIGDRTIVYNTRANRWHEQKSKLPTGLGRWRVNSLFTAYGRTLVADSVDGRIGELDFNLYTEYGTQILRTFATRPFNNNRPMFVSMLELTIESGVGNAEVPDPKIRMDFSDDGGKTFKDERLRGMGKVGEYLRRVIWRRLGRVPRFRVFRFHMSDPVKPVIIKLAARVK